MVVYLNPSCTSLLWSQMMQKYLFLLQPPKGGIKIMYGGISQYACSHVLQSEVFDAKMPLVPRSITYHFLEEIHLVRQQAALSSGLCSSCTLAALIRATLIQSSVFSVVLWFWSCDEKELQTGCGVPGNPMRQSWKTNCFVSVGLQFYLHSLAHNSYLQQISNTCNIGLIW